MAYFAEINEEGLVLRVIVADPGFITSGAVGDSTNWIETFKDGRRKNFAGIGQTYDKDKDAFIPKKPFDSWNLNEENCRWEAPVLKPTDKTKLHIWDEKNQVWETI